MVLPWSKKSNNGQLIDNQLKLQNIKLQQENQKMKVTNRLMKTFDSQMNANKSFPEEMYSTGIKQGKYAGMNSYDNRIARERSRIAVNISPIAESTVNTISTLTVGHGLELESQPMWHLIPEAKIWSDEKKSEWVKTVESRFKLWSRRSSSVYDQSMNRYQQEQQEFYHGLVDGEYFHIYRYNSNTKINPMTIQLIRPEDVRTPTGSTVSKGNCEENGIEYNAKGQAVAYHIYNHSTYKTVRVPKMGARSGRVFVNHVKFGNKRRGVGVIANMIAELVKLGDYEMLEIQAAVVNALYAVWVESPDDQDGMAVLNKGIKGNNAQASATTKDFENWENDRKEIDYSQGGLQVDQLPAGHKINSFDTKRPNVNFGIFSDQVKKNLFASKNMPLSVVDKQFQDSYSASRAELILAWYEIEKYRFNQSFTDDVIYTMWLWGEVLSTKVDAPGFLNDIETREAWAYAKWIGNQRPDIDPLKSVNAHIKEQNRGYKTGKQIAGERDGGDYNNNLIRVKDELQKVADNQKPFYENGKDISLTDQ